jgi:GAF domain-containing protein
LAEYDGQPGRAAAQASELTCGQADADEEDLHAGLIGLAGMVAGALSIEELLVDVAEFAVHAIPGVDGAGVTVARPTEARLHVQAQAVTAEFVRHIDTLQYEIHSEGPCITSMRARRPCTSGAIGEDPRWPKFGGAVARLGVSSALSLPLLIGDQVIGVINAYGRGPDAFTDHAVAMGEKFAGPAAVSVYNAQLLVEAQRRAEQLQRALGSRSVIDQAIGIVRSRSGASAEEAFGRLVRISQSENTKLHTVAERLVTESVHRARARHRPS